MGIFGRTRADDGMAPSGAMTAARRTTRDTDELIGLCRGVLADGAVSSAEAQFLLRWMDGNRLLCDRFPFNVLYPRIARALHDGVIDESEERELLELLMQATGDVLSPESANSRPTELMLDDPPPDVIHGGKAFVFTGVFNYGTRREVSLLAETLGGRIAPSVSRKVHFLIVGNLGSDDWKHSTHGTKILKAIELKNAGASIAIVNEEHWLRYALP
jgi:hypothetical protein